MTKTLTTTFAAALIAASAFGASAAFASGDYYVGGSPDAGLTNTLPQVMGYERAMRFMMENRTVVGAEQARQTDSIALPDGEVVQASGWLRFGVECFQRDLHPPFGIPRIEDFGVFQCGGVSFFGAGDACGE